MNDPIYVAGWKDVYGNLHLSKEEANRTNARYETYKKLLDMVENQKPILRYPDPYHVAEYIIRNWTEIKAIVETT